MTHFRIHIAKLLTFIVALQILNLSIFMQDFDPLNTHPQTIGEINEINSIVEYVAEVVLDHENALPEYEQENTEHKDLQSHKHMPIKLITFDELVTEITPPVFKRTFHYPLNDSRTFVLSKEITPPPPKA
jgi:hypothetical protein